MEEVNYEHQEIEAGRVKVKDTTKEDLCAAACSLVKPKSCTVHLRYKTVFQLVLECRL